MTISCVPAELAAAVIRSKLFDEYMVYERAGTWIIAGGSIATVTMYRDRVEWRGDDGTDFEIRCPAKLTALGEVLDRLTIPGWTAFGWIAFEAAYAELGANHALGPEPIAHMMIPRCQIQIGIEGVDIDCEDDRLRTRVESTLRQAADGPVVRPGTVDTRCDRDWYLRTVEQTVREIDKHAIHRVVISRRIPVEGAADLVESYLHGRAANTPVRSFLLDLGGWEAAGFCPEMVLEVAADGAVTTQPLAGTRRRTGDPRLDAELRRELLSDRKEVYEHAVSVKLAFDELASVCASGSTRIEDFMTVTERGSVQHLASRVSGRLLKGLTGWDALAAVFPATTGSGAPKPAACDYIGRVEDFPRGLYSGAVVMARQDGFLEAALVLRSVYGFKGRYWVQAGAGIVGASAPDREFEETCEKLDSICGHIVERLS